MEIGPRARSGSKECEGNESGMALRVLAWTTGRAEFPATWMRKALQRDTFGGERVCVGFIHSDLGRGDGEASR